MMDFYFIFLYLDLEHHVVVHHTLIGYVNLHLSLASFPYDHKGFTPFLLKLLSCSGSVVKGWVV